MRKPLALLATAALAFVSLTVFAPPAAVAATDSGTFSVLSYNIAGLPEALSSAARKRPEHAVGYRLRHG